MSAGRRIALTLLVRDRDRAMHGPEVARTPVAFVRDRDYIAAGSRDAPIV